MLVNNKTKKKNLKNVPSIRKKEKKLIIIELGSFILFLWKIIVGVVIGVSVVMVADGFMSGIGVRFVLTLVVVLPLLDCALVSQGHSRTVVRFHYYYDYSKLTIYLRV